MNSRPWEDRVAIMKASGAEVFAPHINYQTDDEIAIAMGIIEKEGITHLVGHSLGGILSYYMSNKYKIPALMYNPAFGAENMKYFEQIDAVKNLPVFDRQYAVVGMMDEVVNPFTMLANLKHATVWKVPDLPHRLKPEEYETYFLKFCELENIH
jgi:pimeloyl-ACP methyl ester carboxylesterase